MAKITQGFMTVWFKDSFIELRLLDGVSEEALDTMKYVFQYEFRAIHALM